MNKKILQQISYGMYVVATASKDGKRYGCIMNTLTQVTSENPVICFHLNKDNETTKQLLKTKKVAISILSTQTDPNVISTFGFHSSKEIDKFASFETMQVEGLPVVLDHTIGYIIGDVIKTVQMESHISFFVRVNMGDVKEEGERMTYEYYHKVIKGRAPKSAPTYLEESATDEMYVCDVCGYRVSEKPSADFVCPICGVSAAHFKKQ